MAPSLEEPILPTSALVEKSKLVKSTLPYSTPRYVPGRTIVQQGEEYEHEELLPRFPDVHWDPLVEVPYQDRGLQGHSDFRHLLAEATDVFDYTPKIGTEIHGIRLTQLSDAQRNDLARLIATRGVVFFRNQPDFDIDAQRDLGRYFGTLHKHATTAVPRKPGLEDVHVVSTDKNSKDQRALFTPSFLWHSDVRILSSPMNALMLMIIRSRMRSSHRRTPRSSSSPALHAAAEATPSGRRNTQPTTCFHRTCKGISRA